MTGVQTCALDRKSTRLNSSHTIISYAVFCLKKKNTPPPNHLSSRPTGDHSTAGVLSARHCCVFERHCTALAVTCSDPLSFCFCFFFNDPAPPEIYRLSLPDPHPI